MSASKSKSEVDAEIAKLKALVDKVPARNFFGENNKTKIEAQIRVLSEGLDDSDICAIWGEDGETKDECAYNAAVDALYWMDGFRNVHAPSKSWEDHIQACAR